ncbi:Nodule Cysteine-Rich (NCR) secreted peptide [Medicago truncatula]|uniref:Nodule Cysteine-Rich (NCR) secreted peptide n=1 Tax=Medicago truncatula TaxID=3880 RepID=A0A072UJ01_MEDTR|nr:Nodule Cysteine-Rich (NCR) secreted peptide [Medicago truncatula]
MVEIVKFVYIINIFIFLFLVATNVEAKFTRCFRDSDCPKTLCHSPGKAKYFCSLLSLKSNKDMGRSTNLFKNAPSIKPENVKYFKNP